MQKVGLQLVSITTTYMSLDYYLVSKFNNYI